MTHGPRNDKNYTRTIPKRMRAKALFMVISRKFKDGEIIFIDSFGITTPKTAIAKKSLNSLASISGFEKLSSKKRNAALIAFSSDTGVTKKSFGNIGNVQTVDVRNLNPVSVLGSTFLIIENPKDAVLIISKRVSSQLK